MNQAFHCPALVISLVPDLIIAEGEFWRKLLGRSETMGIEKKELKTTFNKHRTMTAGAIRPWWAEGESD